MTGTENTAEPEVGEGRSPGAFADVELLHDFLTEAGDLLEDVDQKLIDLESRPGDAGLLADIYRGFHTIKGGAGFLDAGPLVRICHRTESLFDRLRSGTLDLTPALLDTILAATGEVRRMFGEMQGERMPAPASDALIAALEDATEGRAPAADQGIPASAASSAALAPAAPGMPDWAAFLEALVRSAEDAGSVAQHPESPVPRPASAPAIPARQAAPSKDATLRVDTARFDHILDLSGEIGLIRNQISHLRTRFSRGRFDSDDLKQFDRLAGMLDTQVSDLQASVMKARLQAVGRVFQKFSRLARDLSRSLGKDVELELVGEQTEVDKNILDELNDPMVHLIRNALDHGIETPGERTAAGKPPRARVTVSAEQVGDAILIEVRDDGRGMSPQRIRDKAVEKGVISPEHAATLDDEASLALIFLPGFSTKTVASDISGRGVGMDVVKTNIQKLKGTISVNSRPGEGSSFLIRLPLTLAILPVLMLAVSGQRYAVPLGAVREVVSADRASSLRQEVAGRPVLVLRGEVMPVFDVADLVGRTIREACRVYVIVHLEGQPIALGVDACLGQDEVMVKPVTAYRARGVSGATIAADGVLMLVLDLAELLSGRV